MDNSTLAKLKANPALNMETYSGYRTPIKMLTGDDLIDAYNLEASEIIHTIDGRPPMPDYKSPFIHKRS